MGFIGIGFMILIGIFMGAFMGSMATASEEFAAWGTGFSALMSVFYIGIAVLYLYPVLKLYQFADQTKKHWRSTVRKEYRLHLKAKSQCSNLWVL